jgi:MFS transporter, OFA family, oxalate/formate antiporter
MSEKKVMNRWLVAIGALLIQLSLGAIYAWSVFTPKLIGAGWTKTQTQIVFAAGLAFFALIMVFAGKILLPKIGPKKLAISGGITLGIGYILAGLIAPTNFYALLFFIGVIGGSGIGLAYVVPIAVGMKWFPDKKGMITGLAVAGFGFGATLWVKLAGSWGHLISSYSIGTTFIVYGVMFLIMVGIGGMWMIYPPEGWLPEGYEPPKADGNKVLSGSVDYTANEMIKTPQYWMIFLTFLFGAGAGLMSIGLMKLFPAQALVKNGMTKVEASAVAGTAIAVFFSIANGLGRIGWGLISDKLGRKLSLIIMTGIQGVVVIAFPYMAGSTIPLYIGATLIGFNFGGNFALFPTITADTFGAKNIGQNYGWVFLAYGVGGIAGPIMGGKLGDMKNFPLAFTIAGALCLVAAVIIALVKPPKHHTEETPAEEEATTEEEPTTEEKVTA